MTNNNFKRKATRHLTKIVRGVQRVGGKAKFAAERRWRRYQRGRGRRKVAERELRRVERRAERRGYREEAERQARLRGERMARRKFAPKPKSRVTWKAPQVDLWGLGQFSGIRLRSVGSVMMSGLGKRKPQRKRKRRR